MRMSGRDYFIWRQSRLRNVLCHCMTKDGQEQEEDLFYGGRILEEIPDQSPTNAFLDDTHRNRRGPF